MERLPVSVFLITLNEADRLPLALGALQDIVDEIVVIDSNSGDGTREVAEALGARVIINTPWPGYGAQKRFGEDQCRNLWLLNLDADEELTATCVDSLRQLFAAGDPPCDGYRIQRREMAPGETRAHPFAYTKPRIRLYRKDRGRFDISPVFDDVRMAAGARVGDLGGLMLHRSVRRITEQVRKFDTYTDHQVDDLIARGRRLPRWRLFVEFPAAFLNAYFLRRYWVHGLAGFMLAMNHAWSRHLRIAKYVEHEILKRVDRS